MRLALGIDTIRKRSTFLEMKGIKASRIYNLVSVRVKSCSKLTKEGNFKIEVGFTVSKRDRKKSVHRNRIKRKLREIVKELYFKRVLKTGNKYLISGHKEALEIPYKDLYRSVKELIEKRK